MVKSQSENVMLNRKRTDVKWSLTIFANFKKKKQTPRPIDYSLLYDTIKVRVNLMRGGKLVNFTVIHLSDIREHPHLILSVKDYLSKENNLKKGEFK